MCIVLARVAMPLIGKCAIQSHINLLRRCRVVFANLPELNRASCQGNRNSRFSRCKDRCTESILTGQSQVLLVISLAEDVLLSPISVMSWNVSAKALCLRLILCAHISKLSCRARGRKALDVWISIAHASPCLRSTPRCSALSLQ